MPVLRIETNLAKNKIPENFANSCVQLIAKCLAKPENFCVAAVIPEVNITFGGSHSICAFVTLMSIGGLGLEENKKLSAAIGEHIQNQLGVEKNKFYIQFIDVTSANVGFNGTTFHQILGI